MQSMDMSLMVTSLGVMTMAPPRGTSTKMLMDSIMRPYLQVTYFYIQGETGLWDDSDTNLETSLVTPVKETEYNPFTEGIMTIDSS